MPHVAVPAELKTLVNASDINVLQEVEQRTGQSFVYVNLTVQTAHPAPET